MDTLKDLAAIPPVAALIILVGGLVYILWVTVLRKLVRNNGEEVSVKMRDYVSDQIIEHQRTDFSQIQRDFIDARALHKTNNALMPILAQVAELAKLLTEHIRTADIDTKEYYQTRGHVEMIRETLTELQENQAQVLGNQTEMLGRLSRLLDELGKKG